MSISDWGVRLSGRALLLCLLISGCATSPQTRQLLDAPPPDLPTRVELEAVPFYPQLEFHCGPAALASIYNFRGIDVTPDDVARQVFVPGLEGSLQSEVVAATRQHDLLPVQLDGRLESILRELDAGNPVFVLQNLGLDLLPRWHYEVVIGYRLDRGEMILRSGTHRRIARTFATFDRTWQRAGNWALAIVPPGQVPATATADAYLAAAIDLEQVGRTVAAHQAYATAVRRWPDNLLALGGRGNTAYALGDFGGAEQAYRKALEVDPARAELWNNLAYALAEQGRYEAALDAIRSALVLDPENPNLRNSFNEILNWH